jgi:S1-C subfamily serine protease
MKFMAKFGKPVWPILIGILLTLQGVVFAQVPSPKHESHWRHMFGAHRDPNNLEQRFDQLKCALVLIESGPRLGTGFYISKDGDIATASHVLGDRSFSLNPNGTINVTIALPPVFYVTDCKGKRTEVSATKLELNPDAWVADVACVKTGNETSYWLREVDDHQSRPGEHLLAMGFPGLSFKALTIYTGIMSARLTTNLPIAILTTGEPITTSTEFIRIQMPISTGLSGAPIIDDENRVVAIITNAGGWSSDLDHLLMAFRGGAFNVPRPPPDPHPAPNTVSFSFNPMAAMAELAGLFHDYASPGYGDAVPLRYLRKPPQQSQPSSSPGH